MTGFSYPTIILDCDGVILDSNEIKTEAFRDVLCDYPSELVETFVQYHRDNGGVSRFAKFKYFFAELLRQPDDARYEQALSDYGERALARLKRAPFTCGARSFVQRASCTSDLFVVSGGMESEVREVLEEKGISGRFRAIKGSPKTKHDHFAWLLSENRAQRPALFIGDSRMDYQVAADFDVDFVFLSGYTDMDDWQQFCEEQGIAHYVNLEDLQGQLSTGQAAQLPG